MFHIHPSSVSEALSMGLQHLLHEGVEEETRNGKTLVAPGPVCTEYSHPRYRVLYSPTRDANPWFHLFEGAIWMLSGSNDLTLPCYFVSSYADFSDDGGKTMWDAYGWRWRRFFGWDQVESIIEELKKNPGSRRCVLSMWNAMIVDTGYDDRTGDTIEPVTPDFQVATHGGKAVPCNTHAYIDLRGGKLNITVCNRSNDAVWGAYGANVVQFSFLQEYIATKLGAPIGVYRQFSNNFHVYTHRFTREWLEEVIYECETTTEELLGPVVGGPYFDEDLKVFLPWTESVVRDVTNVGNIPELSNEFLLHVALPMFLSWVARKNRDIPLALSHVRNIQAPDWQRACREWIERRMK